MRAFMTAGVLVLSLAACGGGGGSSSPISGVVTPPTIQKSAKIVWSATSAPAGTIKDHLRRIDGVMLQDAGTGPVVLFSGDTPVSDGIAYNSAGQMGDASIQVQESPAPTSPVTASFTTTSTAVKIAPTPSPNPSASPLPPTAYAGTPNVNYSESGNNITATLSDSTTATRPVIVSKSIGLVLRHSGAVLDSEYPAYSVDASGTLHGLTTTSGADIYLSGPAGVSPFDTSASGENEMIAPGGEIALTNGSDITTLSASAWANATTSLPLNTTFVTNLKDTVLFKAANGLVCYINARDIDPGNPVANHTTAAVIGAFGCHGFAPFAF